MDLSVAAAHVLGDAGRVPRQRRAARPPGRRRRPGPAGFRRVPGGRRGRRPRVVRRGRAPARRAAHPGGRLPHRRARRRPRRHAVRLATTPRRTTGSSSSPAAASSCPTRSRTRSSSGSARSGSVPVGSAGRPGPRRVRRGRPLRLATCCPPCTGRARRACDVVVDCAHGAAHMVAPEALLRAGAEVEAIGARPDGLNINAGVGSTHLDKLQQVVVSRGADVGHRLRRRRRPLPGRRRTPARSSTATRSWPSSRPAMHAEGTLAKDTVVATVMSNLGFKLAMREAGINVVETAGGRPLRAGGDEGRRLQPRRRAVRPRHHARPRHHRRRPAHLAAPAGGRWRVRASRSRSWRR